MGEPKDERPLAASIETQQRRGVFAAAHIQHMSRSSGSLDCDHLRLSFPVASCPSVVHVRSNLPVSHPFL